MIKGNDKLILNVRNLKKCVNGKYHICHKSHFLIYKYIKENIDLTKLPNNIAKLISDAGWELIYKFSKKQVLMVLEKKCYSNDKYNILIDPCDYSEFNNYLKENYKVNNVIFYDDFHTIKNIIFQNNESIISITLDELSEYLQQSYLYLNIQTVDILFDKYYFKRKNKDGNVEFTQQYGESEIDLEKLNFSNITVVLGKNKGLSSKIVNELQLKLKKIDVDVYVSDSDKLTYKIVEQAANEKVDEDILAIRIGGETNRTKKDIIIANYGDGISGIESYKNSDSLALAIESELRNSIVINGKFNLEKQIKEKTDLEEKIRKIDFKNPAVKTITVAIDEFSTEPNLYIEALFNGIVKYTAMSRKERNDSYIVMYGFGNVEKDSKKYGTNEMVHDYQDSVLMKQNLICNFKVNNLYK